jgi:hypothetical protein
LYPKKPVTFNKNQSTQFQAETVADFGNESRPDLVARLADKDWGEVSIGKLWAGETRPKVGDTAHFTGDTAIWDVLAVFDEPDPPGLQAAPGLLFVVRQRSSKL